jgi:hypothetical protein
LKQEKEEILEKLRVARYCVTAYENEKDEFRAMLKEDKEKIQREKDQLLTEKTIVKEVVGRALRSVPGLAQEEHEAVEVQVMKLAEAIQQLQARVTSWRSKQYQVLHRKCATKGRKPLRVQSKGSEPSLQNANS